MLYVFHGTDVAQSSHKARALVDSLRAKKPDASFVSIAADDWHASIIEEHLGGQGLFSNKYIVFLNRLTENEEAKELLPEFISAMHESANIFIVLEGKLNTELKKAFEKAAEKVVISDLKLVSPFAKKSEFNVFALADAVGSRDPFKAWSIYRQAVDSGIEAENIIGTLFWQVKSMVLASTAKTANEAGLSPFVFSKSKKYASLYSPEELRGLMSDLITYYHDGHRGIVNIELSVERRLLKIK